MLRFLFRIVFKGMALVFLAGVAFVAYHLYQSGRLPFVRGVIEDTAVTASVKAGFAVHRVLSSRPIDVATEDGRVTLAGEVATDGERADAGELASQIEGVEAVDNRLEVDPALEEEEAAAERKSLGERVDDAALLAKIRTALHLDRVARKIDVDVQVSSGHVTLRGRVPSEELAGRIRTRVASVSGVELIDDELEVRR